MKSLKIFLVVVISFIFTPVKSQNYVNDSIVTIVRDSINVYRKSLGLKPVMIETLYKNFADKHSYNQSRYGFVTHGIGNNSFENRIKRNPNLFGRAFQENCCRDFYSDNDGLYYLASQIMIGFKSSKPHNASLINPEYNRMYVSCYKSGEYVYITLIVGD